MVNRYGSGSWMPISGFENAHKRLSDISRKERIDAAFETFHKENPHIWTLFKKYAQEAIDKGVKKYSAAAIIHRLLWDLNVENKSRKLLVRVNHDFSPCYARLYVKEYPQHKSFFNIKERPSEERYTN